MKRSIKFFAPLTVGAATLMTATPAFAQYEDAAGAGIGFGFLCCYGLFALMGLALFVLNVWMIIDAIGRQEYEYPNSTGNSKNTWIILLIVGIIFGFGWIVAVVYYFMVYKKVKRGTIPPPWAGQGGAPGAPPAQQPTAPPPSAPPAAAPQQTPPPPAPPAAPPPPAPPAPPEGTDSQQ